MILGIANVLFEKILGMVKDNTGILGYWDTGIKDNTGIKRSNAGDGKRMNRMSPSAGMNEFLRNGWLDE